MFKVVAQWLRWLAAWLDPAPQWPIHEDQPVGGWLLPKHDMLDAARVEAKKAALLPNTPIKKANTVYKALKKTWPQRPDGEIRLAIELAVSELKYDH